MLETLLNDVLITGETASVAVLVVVTGDLASCDKTGFRITSGLFSSSLLILAPPLVPMICLK